MSKSQPVFDLLDRLKINYRVLSHQPVFTAQDAARITPNLDAAGVKSLLLVGATSRKFYLVVLPDEKRLGLKNLAKNLDEKKLNFATAEQLFSKMKLEAGSVGIFGLIEPTARDIVLLFDRGIFASNQKIAFHPNDNTKTLIFSLQNMEKFLKHLGLKIETFDL